MENEYIYRSTKEELLENMVSDDIFGVETDKVSFFVFSSEERRRVIENFWEKRLD